MELPCQHMRQYKVVAAKTFYDLYICHSSIHKSSSQFPILFINSFCLALSFWLGLLCTMFFATTLHVFRLMPRCFRSVEYQYQYWCLLVAYSYLAFEAINMPSQKPCILCAHFTQAYWTLDTLSPLLLLLLIIIIAMFGWYTYACEFHFHRTLSHRFKL